MFSVETHNVCLTSHTEITGMFLRLWSNHVSVLHDQFHFVEGRAGREIAVRFQVTNKHLDGTLVYKSNCNFFTVHEGRFDSVRVYMSGENTLNKWTYNTRLSIFQNIYKCKTTTVRFPARHIARQSFNDLHYFDQLAKAVGNQSGTIPYARSKMRLEMLA